MNGLIISRLKFAFTFVRKENYAILKKKLHQVRLVGDYSELFLEFLDILKLTIGGHHQEAFSIHQHSAFIMVRSTVICWCQQTSVRALVLKCLQIEPLVVMWLSALHVLMFTFVKETKLSLYQTSERKTNFLSIKLQCSQYRGETHIKTHGRHKPLNTKYLVT